MTHHSRNVFADLDNALCEIFNACEYFIENAKSVNTRASLLRALDLNNTLMEMQILLMNTHEIIEQWNEITWTDEKMRTNINLIDSYLNELVVNFYAVQGFGKLNDLCIDDALFDVLLKHVSALKVSVRVGNIL